MLVESFINLIPIKCIQSNLYDYEDGSFTQWLAKNPYLEDEQPMYFLKAISIMKESLDSFCWDMAILLEDMKEKKPFVLK